MFESAEIGHAIDKDTYEAAVPALREALLEAQFELQQQKRFPVIILINGIEGAGKGETVKLLNEWMDPRLIEVRTFDQQTDEELSRPPAWRYWRMLPAKGRMGIFFGNWYSQMLQGRVHGLFKDPRLDQAIAGAERLEKMLCDEGALIFKFWFHLSKKQMKARLKALADDPLHSWRISPLDWQQSQTYDKFVKYGERVLRRTSRDYAPWHVIEGVGCPLPQPGGRQDSPRRPAKRAEAPGRASARCQRRAAGHAGRSVEPARQPRPDPAPGQERLRRTTDHRTGAPVRADARQTHAPPRVGRGVRRQRCGRQGRGDPPGGGGAGSAPVPHRADCRADRRGARAAVPVAFLAAHSGARQVHRVRPFLVRPRAGGARRRLLHAGRLDARLRRDQRFRRATAPTPG